MLFGDAATLLADPGLTEPARSAARSLAGHLADLARRRHCPARAASRVMWLT